MNIISRKYKTLENRDLAELLISCNNKYNECALLHHLQFHKSLPGLFGCVATVWKKGVRDGKILQDQKTKADAIMIGGQPVTPEDDSWYVILVQNE